MSTDTTSSRRAAARGLATLTATAASIVGASWAFKKFDWPTRAMPRGVRSNS
jgi:hypothetical protein